MIARSDLLLALMGAPHASELVTSTLRLTRAALARDARVQVWTCGYATALTASALGRHKPRNVVDWSREHPSTAGIVGDLIDAADGRLTWFSCRFCSEERGVAAHIPQVRVRAPATFGAHVAAADRTLFLGVI